MPVSLNERIAHPLASKLSLKSLRDNDLGLGVSNPYAQDVFNILSKFGADAHMFVPGPGVPILGPELAGSAFANAAGWSFSGGVLTASSAVAFSTASNSGFLGVQMGKSYQVTYTANVTSGSARLQFVGGTAYNSTYATTSGTFSEVYVPSENKAVINVQAGASGFTGAISGLTVREILGYTNYLNGFAAGNYLESTGNTNASVDGAVGLVLDAAGSVGAELVSNGGFDTNLVGWTTYGSTPNNTWDSLNGGSLKSVRVAASGFEGLRKDILTAGKSYLVTGLVYRPTGSDSVAVLGASVVSNITVTPTAFNTWTPFSAYITANGVQFAIFSSGGSIGATLYWDNISVREVTGTHATQATTANKPILRRGIVNLLTYSNDLTNAAWVNKSNISLLAGHLDHQGNPTAYKIVESNDASPVAHALGRLGATVGAQQTLAAIVAPSGRSQAALQLGISVGYFDLQAGSVITGTAASIAPIGNGFYVCALALTVSSNANTLLFPASGGSATYQGNSTSGILCAGIGLFQGTLTADQIIAAGGIPLTTTAPASSLYGIGEPVLGSELFPQPSLDSTTGIRVDAGWAVSGGVATGTATNTVIGDLAASYANYTQGKLYQVGVNVGSRTAGQLQAYLRGAMVSGFSAVSATGWTYGTVIAGSSTTEGLAVVGINAFSGTVLDVSVKEITGYKSLPNSYAWQFDGSNDVLALPGPLFQMADDHCVVVSGARGFGSGGYRGILFPAGNSATAARAGVIAIDPSGNLNGYYTNDAGTFFTPQLGTLSPGETFVASVVNRSGSMKGRKNGGAFTSPLSPTGACTLNTAGIGYAQGFSYFDGVAYPMIAIKGTVSDAELKLLEKWLGSIAGVPVA